MEILIPNSTKFQIWNSKTSFPVFFWLFATNLLLVRSHQAERIIIKRLIQGCNNLSNESGSWTYITQSCWTSSKSARKLWNGQPRTTN